MCSRMAGESTAASTSKKESVAIIDNRTKHSKQHTVEANLAVMVSLCRVFAQLCM